MIQRVSSAIAPPPPSELRATEQQQQQQQQHQHQQQQPCFTSLSPPSEPVSGPSGSGDPLDQELSVLNKRITAGETECSQLQQTLGEKISKLDELMKRVGAAVT